MTAKILQFPAKKVKVAPLGPIPPEDTVASSIDFDGDVIEISILGFFEMLRQEGLFLKLTNGGADFTPPEGMLA